MDVNLHDFENPVDGARLLFLLLILVAWHLNAVVFQGPTISSGAFHCGDRFEGNRRNDRRDLLQNKLVPYEDCLSKTRSSTHVNLLADFFHLFDEQFFLTDSHGGGSRKAVAGIGKAAEFGRGLRKNTLRPMALEARISPSI